MPANKVLEFSVVPQPGVGHMPLPKEDKKKAAGVFYVAAIRAMQVLVIGAGGSHVSGEKIGTAMTQLPQLRLTLSDPQ